MNNPTRFNFRPRLTRCLFLIGLLALALAFAYPVRGQTAEPDGQPTVLWQVQAEMSLDTPKGIPTGIAVAPDGTIYVADNQLGLRLFSPDGKELPPLKFLPADQVAPSDVAITPKGAIYLTLPDRPDGAIGLVGEDKLTLLTGGQFHRDSPRSIAVNQKGEIFALDVVKQLEQSVTGLSVLKYDADGGYLGQFPTLTGEQLKGIKHIRIAAAPIGGVFLVTDGPQGIYSYAYDGQLIKQGVGDAAITALKPTALAFGPKEQTAVVGRTGQIAFNPGNGGKPISFGKLAVSSGEIKAGTFYAPLAMALSADNRLYVVDQNQDHTQIVAIQFPQKKTSPATEPATESPG